jgi:hypothetical protein
MLRACLKKPSGRTWMRRSTTRAHGEMAFRAVADLNDAEPTDFARALQIS